MSMKEINFVSVDDACVNGTSVVVKNVKSLIKSGKSFKMVVGGREYFIGGSADVILVNQQSVDVVRNGRGVDYTTTVDEVFRLIIWYDIKSMPLDEVEESEVKEGVYSVEFECCGIEMTADVVYDGRIFSTNVDSVIGIMPIRITGADFFSEGKGIEDLAEAISYEVGTMMEAYLDEEGYDSFDEIAINSVMDYISDNTPIDGYCDVDDFVVVEYSGSYAYIKVNWGKWNDDLTMFDEFSYDNIQYDFSDGSVEVNDFVEVFGC